VALQRPPNQYPQLRPPEDERPIPAAPIHPLAALATIVLDQAWGIIEIGAVASIVGFFTYPLLISFTGGMAFLSVLMVQHYVAGDPWRVAVAKALAMGVLAGVPFVVGGTLVGGLLLGWSGLSKLSGLFK